MVNNSENIAANMILKTTTYDQDIIQSAIHMFPVAYDLTIIYTYRVPDLSLLSEVSHFSNNFA